MKKIAFVILLSALFTGCASVKMESKEDSAKAKQFAQPQAGNSGLYTTLELMQALNSALTHFFRHKIHLKALYP